MYKKLTKHFIYNWLGEDAFGEYMLYKPNSALGVQTLSNIWKILQYKRAQKANLFSTVRWTKFIGFFQLNFVRYFVFKTNLVTKGTCILFTKRFFVDIVKVMSLLFKYSNNILKFSSQRLLCVSNHPMSLVLIKLLKLEKRRNYLLEHSQTGILFRHREKNLKGSSQPLGRGEDQQRFILRKAVKFCRDNCVRKKLGTTFWQKRKYFLVDNIIKTGRGRLVRTNKRLSSIWIKKQPIVTHAFGSTSFVFLRKFWDYLGGRLRAQNAKFLNFVTTSKRLKARTNLLRFEFFGTFKKKNVLVRKNEVSQILKYRLFSYYSLIQTNKESNRGLHTHSQYLSANSLHFFEGRVVAVLLRSNFFENGYVTNALLKRGVFLVNGLPVFQNSSILVWDIITIAKPIFWLVYARFYNFFSILISQLYTQKNQITTDSIQGFMIHGLNLSKNFLKKTFRLKSFFKKKRSVFFERLTEKKMLYTRILLLKNLILAVPPVYLEVSYSLFTIIFWNMIYKAGALNPFLNSFAASNLNSTRFAAFKTQ